MQFIELRTYFTPDARLLGGVFNDRWPKPVKPMLPARCEEFSPTSHVRFITESRVSCFQLQVCDIGRLDHDLGVDRYAIFHDWSCRFHGHPSVELSAAKCWNEMPTLPAFKLQ